MMIRQFEVAFIDTNILLYAAFFKKYSVFDWVDGLYKEIIIHRVVLDELLTERAYINAEIVKRHWKIFDDRSLSEAESSVYKNYVHMVQAGFKKVNRKRQVAGKRVKTTANRGEIGSIAACLLTDTPLICSNDFDIREVVLDQNYVYVDLYGEEHLIIQDSLEDFCFYCVHDLHVPVSHVRQFLKSTFENQKLRTHALKSFDDRIDSDASLL
ncbi:hypothetical protein AYR62_02870 [Secundilactobacillus paracollinoides]|uniref:hypothetical protein n=1 Tax=Secundilactobacillus paracollinoides TaxID=240427 RepID=UPI00081A7612|nr:hypothetical protein [Secundilactobacillus paracollinoides]ANZ63142.1 hypothetical protein AYR62_02870 [Secundilactobacillus paracollinoides]